METRNPGLRGASLAQPSGGLRRRDPWLPQTAPISRSEAPHRPSRGAHAPALRGDRDSRLPAWGPWTPAKHRYCRSNSPPGPSRPHHPPMPRAFFTRLLPVRQGPARVTPTLESLHQSPQPKGFASGTSLIPYMTHNIKACDNMCSRLLFLLFIFWGTSLVPQMVKRLPTMQETRVPSLGQEDPLENEMATHSSTLAWKIPWTEKCGRLQSTGSGRVRHD